MDHKNTLLGHICTLMSWMFTAIKPEMITVTLSCILSIMGIINYYFAIKKNRK